MKFNRNKLRISIIISFIVIIQYNPSIYSVKNINNLGVPRHSAVHSPISINDNDALDNFCSGNGTDGLSWETAHVIENYEINAGGTGSCIFILNTDRYLIIQNCTLQGAGSVVNDAGIYLSNVENVIVTNCSVSNNTHSGIRLLGSQNNIIEDNDIFDNERGIAIATNADNNNITGNNIINNSLVGVYISDAHDNIVRDNFIKDGNNGIEVAYARNNVVLNNNLTSQNNAGIDLLRANNTEIKGNIAQYSDNGIDIWSDGVAANDNEISDNILMNNFVGGIVIEGPTIGNKISNNIIFNNSIRGILLQWGSNNNTISDNNITGNPDGIRVEHNSDFNLISGNTIDDVMGFGIRFEESDYNTAHQNIIEDAGSGIVLALGSEHSNISWNILSNNLVGLDFSESNHTYIYRNIILDGWKGIVFDGSDYATIHMNLISNMTNHGIHLINSENTTILGNSIVNTQWGIELGGATWNNTIYMNHLLAISSTYAIDTGNYSYWDNGTLGNYWGDYKLRYPSAVPVDDLYWNTTYQISATPRSDTRPLVYLGIPQISLVDNISIMIGEPDLQILWTVTDRTALDGLTEFMIALNDELIASGQWNSGDQISTTLKDLPLGTHKIILFVIDGTMMGINFTTVHISINEIPSPTISTSSITLDSDNIIIEWDKVLGVDSYNIYINGTLYDSTSSLQLNVSFTQNGVYSITVTCVNGAYESEHSIEIIITVDIPEEPEPIPDPAIPGYMIIIIPFLIGLGLSMWKIRRSQSS